MREFQKASAAAAADERLKLIVTTATMRQYTARQAQLKTLPDADALRTLAGQIRQHVLDHLEGYLKQLGAAVQKNGGRFCVASDAAEARKIVLDIARESRCQRIIKSKSMVSEEIGLTPHLEKAGLEVVETDLGEFIAQISHDRPSHIVAPIVHKDKASIARLFADYFSTPYTEDPLALTQQARLHLREKFRRAEMGITGANFLIAESGHAVTVENEGNVRQSMTTPRVLVAISGIEKILPRLADLSVFVKLLARSATGQSMTIYTNLINGARAAGERDGPEAFHLVLVDNGRRRIAAGECREILRCIRCGACLNACPVYRSIGGHAYGGVYSGPIGALITPLMEGLKRHRDLPQASSLCGGCFEACPVKIDIPRYLIKLRGEIRGRHLNGFLERLAYRWWARGLSRPVFYRMGAAWTRFRFRRRAGGTGWITRLGGAAGGWTEARDMPAPARKSFRQLWKGKRHGR